jgi:hypothetical protein
MRLMAVQSSIELQTFPIPNRLAVPSPIRSEGSCATFVTASEGLEPKDDCEVEGSVDPGEVDQSPWLRGEPAPFVGAQFGQAGPANGSPPSHAPRGRERVRSGAGNPNSENKPDSHNRAITSVQTQHVADTPPTSSQPIQTTLGTDVLPPSDQTSRRTSVASSATACTATVRSALKVCRSPRTI